MTAYNNGVPCHSGFMTTVSLQILTERYNFIPATVSGTATTGRNTWAAKRNFMRNGHATFLLALFVVLSLNGFSQTQSLPVLQEQWAKVKSAQVRFSEAVVRFCNLPDMQATYRSFSSPIVAKAQNFGRTAGQISYLDSASAARVEAAQEALLTEVINFSTKVQQNAAFVNKPAVKAAGKEVEGALQNLALRIHDFNYWVQEKNGFNIRFRELRL